MKSIAEVIFNVLFIALAVEVVIMVALGLISAIETTKDSTKEN